MQLAREIPNPFYGNQHQNPANEKAHLETTAEEICQDSEGTVDSVVAALGSTGTAMSISKALKPRKASMRVVGVEPRGAPVLAKGERAPDKIPGTIPGFVTGLYDSEFLDEIVLVDVEEEAYPMCRRLVREEGLFVRISSRATAAAALKLAKRPELKGRLIVAIFADTGQRYLSVKGLYQ